MAQPQTYGQSGPQSSPDTLGSVDIYAEKLMDDIFQDIDRVLEGGSLLPKETAKPEFLALKSIKVPQLSLVPKTETPKTETDDSQVNKKAKKKNSDSGTDRILLGAALLSVLATSSLWVLTRGGFEQILEKFMAVTSAPEPQPVASIDPQLAENQQFANYIERSLDLMDQKNAASKKWLGEPGALPNNSPDNLPKVAVSGKTPQELELLLPLNRIADLMESQAAKPPAILPPAQVVVIPAAPTNNINNNPVATNQKNQTVAKSSPKANSPAPVASSQDNQSPLSKIATKIVERLTPKPVYPSPLANNPENQTVNQVAPSPEENVIANVAPDPNPVAIPPAPVVPADPAQDLAASNTETSNGANTLVGILELGDRSAALFEIDGVARRIYVGEKIGSSGWLLEKVANNEAIIRRNDEVQAISVGAKF
ncbi:MAG: hypothetical protein ACRC2J_18240 [Microcoleaceae cyanobacterium]